MRPYDTHRWKTIRLEVLRQHPLCIRCQNVGVVKVATTIDHCIPAKAYDDFFDTNNLFSVCTQCHSDITKHFDNRNAHEAFKNDYASIKYSHREFSRNIDGFILDEDLDSLLLGMEVVGNKNTPRRFE
ncbi:MAG: HNH endonuclease [Sulfurimonas sp.]|nr:HNH endonuclease [Sulfurimonas sp.]